MRVVRSEPRIKHALPGRLRLHVPQLTNREAQQIEGCLRRAAGVRGVWASPLTSSVLILFDPHVTGADQLLGLVRGEQPAAVGESRPPRHWLTPTLRHALETLAMLEKAQEPARLLLEGATHLPRLAAAPPAKPATPLEASLRAAVAALGVGLAGVQRLLGKSRLLAPVRGVATTAGFLALLGYFPFFRRGLRRILGPRRAELVLVAADLVSSALGGGLLGLGISVLEVITHLNPGERTAQVA